MSRFVESSPTLGITRSQRGRPFGWRRRLAAALIGVLTLGAGLVGVPAATAGAAVAATPAGSPSASAGCGRLDTVKVYATRSPSLNRRAIQEAIVTAEGRRNGCALLIGHFNLGFCVLCLTVTGPVTVSGQADPTGSFPDRNGLTVVSARGGSGWLQVNEPPDVPTGVVQIRDIWWDKANGFGLAVHNSYRGTVEFIRNRITNIRDPRGPFRGAIGAGNGIPGTEVLEGSVVVQDNYIDLTTTPRAPVNDNGIAFFNSHFTSIDISHNTSITTGDSVEIEGSVGSSYNVSDNTIVTKYAGNSPFARVVVTVGYPGLHGGDPNALKMAGNDAARTIIRDNKLTVGGGGPTSTCIEAFQVAPSIHPTRLTEISGNRCTMSGIFAGLLAGWAGLLPTWGPGTLDNAIVTNNIFTGTAAFGIAMLDFKYPVFRFNSLVNTSHGNVFRDNNFSAFTASQAALYLGPSTHDNLFVGSLRGTIVNLGTHNVIITH